MRRYTVASLLVLVVGATTWAYFVADALIREFHENITYIDLSVLFVLGLIAGIGLGLIVGFRRGGLHAG